MKLNKYRVKYGHLTPEGLEDWNNRVAKQFIMGDVTCIVRATSTIGYKDKVSIAYDNIGLIMNAAFFEENKALIEADYDNQYDN